MENGEILAKLLWMDDVALIHEETKQLQEILDTTNHVALTNHIEFGENAKWSKLDREKSPKSPWTNRN